MAAIDSIKYLRISKYITHVCAECVSPASHNVYNDSIIFFRIFSRFITMLRFIKNVQEIRGSLFHIVGHCYF